MVEAAFVRRSLALAALPLGIAVLLLTAAQHRPHTQRLFNRGDTSDFALAAGQDRFFTATVAAASILHLVLDQNGADVEIQLTPTSSRVLPTIDLPLGSRVREEAYFEAEKETELTIRIRAVEGSGQVRLTVAENGTGSDELRTKAREAARYWRSATLDLEARRTELRRLAESAADRRLRAISASTLAVLEDKLPQTLADLELALREIPENTDPALKGQLALMRARTLMQIDLPAAAAYREALAASLSAGDLPAAAVAEAELGTLAWHANRSREMASHFAAASHYYSNAGYVEMAKELEIQLARSLMRRGDSPEAPARFLRLLGDEMARKREEPDKKDAMRAELLLEIGWWLYLENRPTEGRELAAKAIKLDPEPVGVLQRLASIEIERGDFAAARLALKQASDAGPTSSEKAGIAVVLCKVDVESGAWSAARKSCPDALVQLETNRREGSTPNVQVQLARLAQHEGHLAEAESWASKATEEIEIQRLKAGSIQERLDFLAVRANASKLLVTLRLALHAANSKKGWDLAALAAAEQTRARLLADLLQNDHNDSISPEIHRREQELRQILGIRCRGLLESLLNQGLLPETEIRRLDPLLRELEALRSRAEIESDLTPAAASTFDPDLVTRELGPGVVMLVFHLSETEGTDQAFGWALTRHSIRGADLGSATRIRNLAAALHELLAGSIPDYRRDFQTWSQTLSSRLLTPLGAEVAGARTLVIVAPAELQQVPFSALPFPANSRVPLVVTHSVTVLPSAGALPALRRRAAEKVPGHRLLAIIDDPVYDGDPRLPITTRQKGQFPPLPDTAMEGSALLALAGSENGSRRITGFSASRDNLLGKTLQDFRILHFATHARTGLSPRGLVLSRFNEKGNRIADVFGFPELASLSLDADLAVTSACSSALGEVIPGEGLLGLSYGFVSSGVPRLLLTLWPVQGRASRRLIEDFYRRLLAGEAPSEALRQVQLDLHEKGIGVREWAAFELHGDWKPLPDFPRALTQQNSALRVDNGVRGKELPTQP